MRDRSCVEPPKGEVIMPGGMYLCRLVDAAIWYVTWKTNGSVIHPTTGLDVREGQIEASWVGPIHDGTPVANRIYAGLPLTFGGAAPEEIARLYGLGLYQTDGTGGHGHDGEGRA